MKVIIYDIEIYPDTMILVFKEHISNQYNIFTISPFKNDRADLHQYIVVDNNKSAWVGYNNGGFDDHLLYYVLEHPTSSVQHYKDIANKIIEGKVRIKPWELKKYFYLSLDMMEILNMDITSAKTTSLKQWKFNLRKKDILDLPFDHTKELVTQDKIDKVITYCIDDVDTTQDILSLNKEQLDIRKDFGKMSGLNMLSLSEVSLAKTYLTKVFSEKLEIDEREFKKLRTYHDQIIIKDILTSNRTLFDDDINKQVYDYYSDKTLIPTLKSKVNSNLKTFSLKNVLNYEIVYPNSLTCTYGSGGIHGVVKPGIYCEDDNYYILDFDFGSYYPHLIGNFNIEPFHLPKGMLGDQLLEWFNERNTKYPKKTHFSLNYSLKIIMNLCYGQLGSEYSPLHDQKAQLSVCINGMLYITKLIELAFKAGGDVLYANTDGIGVKIHKDSSDNLIKVLQDFADSIKIPLEYGRIKKWILLDVNNYIVIDQYNSIKQKGLFETYDTITNNKMYWKDTSANIIPLALNNYFIDNVSVEETVFTHNNIHDFCKSAKSNKEFDFITSVYDSITKVIKSKVLPYQRIIRYYVSNNGYTLSKLWKENSKKGVAFDSIEASSPILLCSKINIPYIYDTYKDGEIKIKSVKRYPDINFDWYVNQCQKIIDTIEGNFILK